MTGNAASKYRVYPLHLGEGYGSHTVYLIASPFYNKFNNCNGFVLYKTEHLESWDIRDDVPFINSILFSSEDEAFAIGSEIVKSYMAVC